MNFTTNSRPRPEISPAVSRPGTPWRAALLVVGAAVLISVVAAPAIAPYHDRARAVYITLVPLTVGYAWGALDRAWMRRRLLPVLAGAALVLLAALIPRLRTDVPPLPVLAGLAGGLALAVALLRIGMLQAGIGWRNHAGNDPEDYAPHWYAALALGFAWVWLAVAVLQPRESFAPTRWLLTVTGAPPPAAARGEAQVRLLRCALTGAVITPERGLVTQDGYEFRVGPLTAGPGSLQAAVSVRRANGKPFGRPVWLTLDADDPAHPAPGNDAQYFNVSVLDPVIAVAGAASAAAASPRLTAYAWYALTQSLPAIHLRARLWTLDTQTADRLTFLPLAEADLGTWNLTILRKLRPSAP
jgi:hypothetical protein